jgi:hypothetical protein
MEENPCRGGTTCCATPEPGRALGRRVPFDGDELYSIPKLIKRCNIHRLNGRPLYVSQVSGERRGREESDDSDDSEGSDLPGLQI